MKPYELLLMKHQYAEAAVLLEQELEHTRKSQNKSETIQTLVTLGVCYYEIQRLEEARTVLEEALEIARSEGSKQGVLIVLHELSMVVSAQGDNDKAIEMCKESVEMRLEQGKEPSLELHTLSVFYQKAGRWDEAMEILVMVRESCEARNDLEGLGRCLNEIGLIYQEKGEVADAVKYLVDSIELKRRIGYERGIEATLRNLNLCMRKYPFAVLDPEVRQQLERLRGILE
jgi:tetratricopeptide (TPR) repeat protein